MGSFEVLLVIFSTFSSQNLKYPTLMHWLESWVNPTSKTDIPCLPTTSQVPPVQFSWDSVALNFRPIWCHGPSLKHCVPQDGTIACDRVPSFAPPSPPDLMPGWTNYHIFFGAHSHETSSAAMAVDSGPAMKKKYLCMGKKGTEVEVVATGTCYLEREREVG